MKAFALLALVVCQDASPIPDATTTRRGVVSTGIQAFSGLKTFDGGIATSTINSFNPVLRTTSPMVLYVEADGGSDANPCTLAAPCLTPQRAVNRVPKFIAHDVSILIGNGTYTLTQPLTIEGFVSAADTSSADGGAFTTIPVFTIAGNTVALAPTTGTATGTLTGFTASTGSSLAVLTDSSQSWTTNALQGHWVTLTSGPSSGQRRVIVENTATTISVHIGFTSAPTAGNTYSLQTTGAMLTTAATNRTLLIRNNVFGLSGGGTPTVSTLGIENTRTASAAFECQGPSPCTFQGVRAFATATSSSCGTMAGTFQGQGVCFGSTSGSGIFATVEANRLSVADSYIRAGSSGLSAGSAFFQFARVVIDVTSTSSTVAGITFSRVIALNTAVVPQELLVRCVAGSGPAGLSVGNGSLSFLPSQVNQLAGRVGVIGCGVGLFVGINSSWDGSTGSGLFFTNTTTGVSVSRGGKVNLPASTTFTTVTNELSLDGVNSTYSAFQALNPRVLSNAYTSVIAQ